MSPQTRSRKFDQARARQLRNYARLTKRARTDIVRILERARRDIRKTLRGAPTEWQSYHLPKIRQEVNAALARFEERGDRVWNTAAESYWTHGIDLVDAPLAAAGVQAILPSISDRQLAGLKGFLTNRIRDISAKTRQRINAQLVLTIAGAQTPGDTINAVQSIMGASRRRAITITRTELGRAYSMATDARQRQAARVVPGLKKAWRRSEKLSSRLDHDAIDGQVRDVDEPFDIGGVQLMYPRDPTAPAKHTINCGCVQVPHKDDWETTHPQKKPFSPREIAANPERAELNVAPLPAPEAWRSKNVFGNPADVLRTDTRELRAVGRFLKRHPVKTLLLKRNEMARGRTAQRIAGDVGKYLGKGASLTHFTARSSRVLGFTSQSYDHVVVKTRAGTRFGDADRDTITSTVKQATEKPGQHFTIGSDLKGTTAEGQTITWLHELGHQVHYKTGLAHPPAGAGALTRYARYNEKEWHAEHFVAWALDRDALAAWDPAVAAHFDQLMESFLDDRP